MGYVEIHPQHTNSSQDLNVAVQDQTTRPVEYFLTNKVTDVTLAADVDQESHYITLEAGHGFTAEDYIEIKYDDGVNMPRHFQGVVVDVDTNTITVMPSLDFYVDTGFIVSAKRCDADFTNYPLATIDNPVEFDISPVDGLSYDLTAITVGMILTTAADDGLFGNIAALTNGVYFGGKTVLDGEEYNVFHAANVRDNGDFRSYCSPNNVVYTTRSTGGGSYGVSAEKVFAGQSNLGVAIRLIGNSQYFYVSLHDDVSAITRLRMKVRGHVVED